MILPDEAIRIISLQRSNYGRRNNIKHIKKMYNQDIETEFNQIISVMGDFHVKKLVDIGCGLAGVSLQLSHYYRYPKLYLIDKDLVPDKVRYGFSENPSFYNSFKLLKEIIEMNYIENVQFVDPDNDFTHIKNVDLVISLLACGFHFPLYFYFGRIYDCLSDDGVFICDIRKTEYENEIKQVKLYFKNISEIKTDNPKTVRICAKEKICQA